MSQNHKLFIVCVAGTYGGQWYCAVYADSATEANEIANHRYPVRRYDEIGDDPTSTPVEIEFTDGISNLWLVGW